MWTPRNLQRMRRRGHRRLGNQRYTHILCESRSTRSPRSPWSSRSSRSIHFCHTTPETHAATKDNSTSPIDTKTNLSVEVQTNIQTTLLHEQPSCCHSKASANPATNQQAGYSLLRSHKAASDPKARLHPQAYSLQATVLQASHNQKAQAYVQAQGGCQKANGYHERLLPCCWRLAVYLWYC